ncbi:bisdemethoxycurcumin synthase-like [Oryza brachyantha]|uniref:bisdemethoxycurcumin synthase-like n=1 Tax=Oryza brachyantha TaxID=4533 RepID=UPI001ADAF282|nr:bisdemethoxycurcumin synthase-like [Oryza brachyantha]
MSPSATSGVQTAIGTANPATCVAQDDYPADYYFRITNSEHLTHLKAKLKTICQASGADKRFFYHTEELIAAHPELLDRATPSLDARLDIAAAAAPELAASAARKAIARWGRPATDVIHLVVSTNSGAQAPSVDHRLALLLGLSPTVRRTMLHLGGCSAGAASLRLAKDLAENSRGARVLVVCVELNVVAFHGPREDYPQTLTCQAVFGDGAGAVIVGADAVHPVERPLFEMVAVSQTVLPETEHVLNMRLTEHGLDGHISIKDLIPLAAGKAEENLTDAFRQLGLAAVEWNDMFWAVHPGIPSILDRIETALRLDPGKLAASRRVVREYGNMLGASLMFVLDEQHRRMEEEGDGAEWGVMMGFGPGFTIETMVLHSPEGIRTYMVHMKVINYVYINVKSTEHKLNHSHASFINSRP